MVTGDWREAEFIFRHCNQLHTPAAAAADGGGDASLGNGRHDNGVTVSASDVTS